MGYNNLGLVPPKVEVVVSTQTVGPVTVPSFCLPTPGDGDIRRVGT